MSMTAKAAKAKGNRLEMYLVQRLRETVDVNTHKTNASGAGIDKNDVRIPSLNIELECKNAATFNLQSDWDQARAQKTSGNMSMLAIRHPKLPEFQETLIAMDLEDFIALLQGQQSEREVSFTADKDSKWKVKRLMESAREVIKLFDKTSL